MCVHLGPCPPADTMWRIPDELCCRLAQVRMSTTKADEHITLIVH